MLCLQSFSQTFTSNAGGNIPDNALVFFPVTVTGLPTTIDSTNFGLTSVCVNINHTYVGQIDLYIKSPNGTLVKLANNRGGNGKNYTNTCFTEAGTLPIQSGVAPFIGSFIPDESINNVNTGINPNGVWFLGVNDEIPFNTGTVLNFSITFSNNPPPTPIISLCTLTSGKGCKCPDGSNDCDLLPDMTNSARVIQTNYYDEPGVVHVGVGTPNIGYGPLEIRGTGECYCGTTQVPDASVQCPNGDYPKEKVVQRVYHKSNTAITYTDRFAGYMQYHPSHGHVHLDNWTFNTLRIKGPQADPLKWPIVGQDSKVSFCLVNNYNCSASLGYCTDVNGNTLTYSNAGNPGIGTASGCARQQGIFPGYLDIYFPGYDGQELHFPDGLCNGWYYVVSVTDPYNNIVEQNENNNIAVVPVLLAFQNNTNCCKGGFTADTLSGVGSLKVSFADTSKPSSDKWLWNFGDGTTDTTQFPIHTYTKAGNYSVTLQTRAKDVLCKDSVTKTNYIQVRPKPTPENPYNVNVYPNPFKDVINVFFYLPTPQQTSIMVYDIAGRSVYQSPEYSSTAGSTETKISLSNLSTGLYFVKVTIGKEVKYMKVLKSNN